MCTYIHFVLHPPATPNGVPRPRFAAASVNPPFFCCCCKPAIVRTVITTLNEDMDTATLQRIEACFCKSGNVKTRRYNLKFYPNTWTGKSLVDWLVEEQVCFDCSMMICSTLFEMPNARCSTAALPVFHKLTSAIQNFRQPRTSGHTHAKLQLWSEKPCSSELSFRKHPHAHLQYRRRTPSISLH